MNLIEMLSWCRPHGSLVERAFVKKYILAPNAHREPEHAGPMENIIIVTDPASRTLFSCHTDTVHTHGGIQTVRYDEGLALAYKDDGEPLGADDTTGVWLMLEMIKAGVPGTYIFHRGEEVGGLGSQWMANNRADWLRSFARAIAFDRKDISHVVTHQRGGRCCSDAFAQALSAQLGERWAPNDGGTFTDTANYTALIPECTNLSVGYEAQHTGHEVQDVEFAVALLEKLKTVDWETLPVEREAKEKARSFSFGGFGWDEDYEYREQRPVLLQPAAQSAQAVLLPVGDEVEELIAERSYQEMCNWSVEDLQALSVTELQDAVRKAPELAVRWIYEALDRIEELNVELEYGGLSADTPQLRF